MITNGLDATQTADLASTGDQRVSWKLRAIRATKGNQSQLGAILIAVLGRLPKHPPRFGLRAVITSDGFVLADFQGKDYVKHSAAFVCDVSDLTKNFRGLADHLKLNKEDREEMFAELRKWIARDYRAKSTLD